MADLALALIIGWLFLFDFTQGESGVAIHLSPRYYDSIKIVRVYDRDVLHITVTNDGILLDNDLVDRNYLREEVLTWLERNQMANTSKFFYIRIGAARDSEYRDYIAVINILKEAYRLLKDRLAENHFGKKFIYLAQRNRDKIKELIRTHPYEETVINLNNEVVKNLPIPWVF